MWQSIIWGCAQEVNQLLLDFIPRTHTLASQRHRCARYAPAYSKVSTQFSCTQAQIGNMTLQDTSLKKFEQGWRLGCEGLFRLARSVTPHMIERGSGTIIVTSATAALRGNRGQHSHAAAMGGRRMLCQTLGHELGPLGIHVCHVVVDGAVNAPDTLGRMVGADAFARIQMLGDRILQPEHIADTYFHIASQHRSVWTNELDLRPYSEQPWYTSGSGPPIVASKAK